MDIILKRYLKSITYGTENFPIVALIGPRQVGKTTSLKLFAKNKRVYDLERDSDFDFIVNDPEFFLSNLKVPIFIDEAQLSDKLFRALRVFIDKNRKLNFQIMISGSSSPELLSNISETLAGRVTINEIFPFTLGEIEKTESSTIYEIFKSGDSKKLTLLSIKKRNWTHSLWWGGYPEPVLKNDLQFKNIWCENYIQSYIDRDIRRLFPDLNIAAYKTFIKLLANSSGEIINFASWASVVGVSEPTIKNYLRIAEGTFLFRTLPAFAFHTQKRLTKAPKGQMKDTGLLCALLRIESPEDLIGHPRSGFIFESFCIEQLLKSFKIEMIQVEYSHYRTKEHNEIDLILEFSKFKIPVEIKLGCEVRTENLKVLAHFIKEHNCPFGVIINNSEEVLELKPGIFQIPFGCL